MERKALSAADSIGLIELDMEQELTRLLERNRGLKMGGGKGGAATHQSQALPHGRSTATVAPSAGMSHVQAHPIPLVAACSQVSAASAGGPLEARPTPAQAQSCAVSQASTAAAMVPLQMDLRPVTRSQSCAARQACMKTVNKPPLDSGAAAQAQRPAASQPCPKRRRSSKDNPDKSPEASDKAQLPRPSSHNTSMPHAVKSPLLGSCTSASTNTRTSMGAPRAPAPSPDRCDATSTVSTSASSCTVAKVKEPRILAAPAAKHQQPPASDSASLDAASQPQAVVAVLPSWRAPAPYPLQPCGDPMRTLKELGCHRLLLDAWTEHIAVTMYVVGPCKDEELPWASAHSLQGQVVTEAEARSMGLVDFTGQCVVWARRSGKGGGLALLAALLPGQLAYLGKHRDGLLAAVSAARPHMTRVCRGGTKSVKGHDIWCGGLTSPRNNMYLPGAFALRQSKSCHRPTSVPAWSSTVLDATAAPFRTYFPDQVAQHWRPIPESDCGATTFTYTSDYASACHIDEKDQEFGGVLWLQGCGCGADVTATDNGFFLIPSLGAMFRPSHGTALAFNAARLVHATAPCRTDSHRPQPVIGVAVYRRKDVADGMLAFGHAVAKCMQHVREALRDGVVQKKDISKFMKGASAKRRHQTPAS